MVRVAVAAAVAHADRWVGQWDRLATRNSRI